MAAQRADRDAGYSRLLLLVAGLLGELVFGGLIFGWPALSLVYQTLGWYATTCVDNDDNSDYEDVAGTECQSQQKTLVLIFNIGAQAVNFAPILAGPALDWLGPKLVATLGALTSALGSYLMGALDFLHLPWSVELRHWRSQHSYHRVSHASCMRLPGAMQLAPIRTHPLSAHALAAAHWPLLP